MYLPNESRLREGREGMERIDEEMKIIERNINELINAEYNPRKLSKDQEKALMDSLTRFGVVDPVIVNTHPERENIIVGGHQRCKVWEKLGNDTIPTVEVSLSYDKERELNVRLNKNTGEFDWDLLNDHFESQQLLEWGFEINELDFKIDNGEVEEDDYEMPDEVETDIVYGDIIEIGPHRLMCGDSTNTEDVEKLMNGEKADMVHTDPPYNIAYEGGSKKREKIANDKLDDFPDFLRGFYSCAYLATKKGGACYVWHAPSETHNFISTYIESGFLFKSYIIWNKNNSTFGRSDYHWKHEPCIYGWKDGGSHKWYGDRKQTTVWNIDRPSRSEEHPTMKPIELCSIPIKNSSLEKNIILDLFLGSGSTMVAAHQLNRKCYGMELAPQYCQVIIDRMIKLDPSLEVKVNGLPYHQEEIVA